MGVLLIQTTAQRQSRRKFPDPLPLAVFFLRWSLSLSCWTWFLEVSVETGFSYSALSADVVFCIVLVCFKEKQSRKNIFTFYWIFLDLTWATQVPSLFIVYVDLLYWNLLPMASSGGPSLHLDQLYSPQFCFMLCFRIHFLSKLLCLFSLLQLPSIFLSWPN